MQERDKNSSRASESSVLLLPPVISELVKIYSPVFVLVVTVRVCLRPPHYSPGNGFDSDAHLCLFFAIADLFRLWEHLLGILSRDCFVLCGLLVVNIVYVILCVFFFYSLSSILLSYLISVLFMYLRRKFE